MSDKAIIIFQKNRVPGQVKTRLAATIGNENALRIYEVLIEKAHQNATALKLPVFLYFSSVLEPQENWPNCSLRVQVQADLGIRMKEAINDVLLLGFKKVVLMGTDCFELTPEILSDAFLKLESSDYVIGPANDGGYYLIGSTRSDCEVFENKTWSTETVCEEAIASILAIQCTVSKVATLNDVDVEADLGELKSLVN